MSPTGAAARRDPRRTMRPILVTLVAAAALCTPPPGRAAELEPRARRVLALHAMETGVPSDALFTSGLRTALPLGSELSLSSETIDELRSSEPAYDEGFRAWLRTKYARAAPDVIVAIGEDAIEFLADRARTPFPGVPVVFGLVEDRMVPTKPLPPGFTGVVEHLAVAETLALARTLLPETRHVALVGGASRADRSAYEVLRAQVAAAGTGLDVIELAGLPMAELQARLRKLPPHTVVMVLSYSEDGAGRQWVGTQSIPAMSSASPAPIFTTYAHLIGLGALGGVVADYEETGKLAASTVLRVLGGERAEAIPTRAVGANRILLDGRQLERWDVPDARVPPDAELLRREPSVWARHRLEIVAVLGGFVLQSVLIGLLLLERRRRSAAEAKARENLAIVAHMNRVSAFGELVGSLAHELNSPLGAVLSNAQAAQRLIAAGKAVDDADVRACLADIVRDVNRASEVIRRIRGALRKGTWEPVDLDVRAVVREAYRLVEADARDRGVAVQMHGAPALPAVHGDEVQIVQVVLNLLLNAIDAVATMPDDRRRVWIGTRAVGGKVAIRVEDSGPGVPPDVAARIFEPFFTTKPVGLGMGLSISKSIVEAHGGTIALQAVPGGGASFEVLLPAARRAGAAPREHAAV